MGFLPSFAKKKLPIPTSITSNVEGMLQWCLYRHSGAATLEPHWGWHQYFSTARLCLAAPDWINLPCHCSPSDSPILTYSTLLLLWLLPPIKGPIHQDSDRFLPARNVPSYQIHPTVYLWSSPLLPLSGYMINMKCSAVIRQTQWHLVSLSALTAHWTTHWLLWKSPWATVNWYSGISIPHFDLGIRYKEGNSSMLERILWKHQGHHDLQITTNPPNFKVQQLFPRYWAKQCCLYECEPTTAAN